MRTHTNESLLSTWLQAEMLAPKPGSRLHKALVPIDDIPALPDLQVIANLCTIGDGLAVDLDISALIPLLSRP